MGFVQIVQSQETSGSVLTSYDSPPITPSAGSALAVVWNCFGDAGVTVTVTDSAGNSWNSSSVPSIIASPGGHSGILGMAFALNIGGSLSGDVITMSMSPGREYVGIKVLEYTGWRTASALDATDVNSGAVAVIASNPWTTDTADELLLVAALDHSEANTFGSGIIAGTSGTVRTNSSTPGFVMDRTVSAIQTAVTAQATDGGEVEPYANCILVATFRLAAGAMSVRLPLRVA